MGINIGYDDFLEKVWSFCHDMYYADVVLPKIDGENHTKNKMREFHVQGIQHIILRDFIENMAENDKVFDEKIARCDEK